MALLEQKSVIDNNRFLLLCFDVRERIILELNSPFVALGLPKVNSAARHSQSSV